MPFGLRLALCRWRGSVFPEVPWRSRRTFATGPARRQLVAAPGPAQPRDPASGSTVQPCTTPTGRRSPSGAAMPAWRVMRDFYIGKGWTAGPHLYLRLTDLAPDPAEPRGGAGVCNRTRWGIEVARLRRRALARCWPRWCTTPLRRCSAGVGLRSMP